MPIPGNSITPYIAYWQGNPTGASTSALDCPQGSLVIDYVTPAVWWKASANNSSFTPIVTPGTAGALIVTPVSPLTGATVDMNTAANNETIYVTPAGTIAALTVVFPPDADSVIGQIERLISTQNITSLTLTANGNTIVGTQPTGIFADQTYTWQKTAAATWALLGSNPFSGAIIGGGQISSTSPTGGIGYITGSGGAVTQITSVTTGVTLNKVTGQITTVALTLAAGASARFTVTNSAINLTDIPVLSPVYGGAGTLSVWPTNNLGGSFDIVLFNAHPSAALNSTAEINFGVYRGSSN
jgi:hypothetical protein